MTIRDPRDIPGLVVWYSTDYLTTLLADGEEINVWPDLSGNLNHAPSVTNGTVRPVYVASGGPDDGPYVQFSPSEQNGFALPANLMDGWEAGQMFLTARPSTTDGTSGAWNLGGDEAMTAFIYLGIAFDEFGTTARKNTGGGVSRANWLRYSAMSKTGEWTNWMNGVQKYTTATNTVAWTPNPVIGRSQNHTGTLRVGGDTRFGAFLLFNRELTPSERTSIDEWLEANPSGGLRYESPEAVLGGKCSTEWRVEALDLVTGARKRILKPVSFNFEEVLNEVGNGSVTLNVHDVRMNDVWPHTTKIAFLRIAGPGATPALPVCEFVGIVEAVQAESGGTMTLGLKSIEEYLAHRFIRVQMDFVGYPQTHIASDLVNAAQTGGAFGLPGIALSAESYVSAYPRDRHYYIADRKPVLEAIQQLTQVINGPDYFLQHSPTGASSTMMFIDRAGGTGILNARRGITSYSLNVDAENHTNRVVGLGEGAVGTVAEDIPAGHAAWERVETYDDVSVLATAVEHASGSLANDKSPAATPEITLAGLDLIAPLSLGDTINLTMGNGALQYKGDSRIVGIAWASDEESPTTATLTLTPGTAGVDAVLNAPISDAGCCGGPA